MDICEIRFRHSEKDGEAPGGLWDRFPAGVFYQVRGEAHPTTHYKHVEGVFATRAAAEKYLGENFAPPALVMTPPPAPRPANIKREKMPLQFELPVFFGLFEGE